MPTLANILLFVYALLLLAANVAAAEEPCKQEGDKVICEKTGFDVLIQKTVRLQNDLKSCNIRLEATQEAVIEVNQALSKCIGSLPPPPKPTTPPSVFSRVAPVMAGVIGGSLLTAAVVSEWPLSARGGGAVVGLALVSAGIMFALP